MPFMPRHYRRPIAVAALASALALTATGCLGGDDKAKGPFDGKSDQEIVKAATTATKAATSLTMTIEGTMAMDRTKKLSRMTARMALHNDGRCTGVLSVVGQGRVEIVVTGKDLYMRPDETFMRSQLKVPDETGPAMSAAEIEGVVRLTKGKWLKEDATSADSKEVADFCDLDNALKDLGTEGTAGIERVGETTVNKQKALKFTKPSAVKAKKGTTVREELYVATEGEPYVLKITGTPEKEADGGLMTAVLSDFNKAPLPKIPAPAEVMDPEKMG
ncbi:hypothetical protein [Streptomyces qinzhouensis]|uniref:Lipoprotein n=1 Tax=Streptomyces qinzhouensis TaxID=2599401 RepID=A0A5B8J9R6_9ACTN|nr:hypothetical protein [Streptomyces qinzhouensis]QDY77144.1 hypothetical protein FQU76_12145 [Streptomyces qinzhouensis]